MHKQSLLKHSLTLLLLLLPLSHLLADSKSTTEYIPSKAYPLIPIVHEKTLKLIPDHPLPPYFGALIEHESCITLTHKRCWSPVSRLKTKREEGAGLFQLTRAYRKDRSIRFDVVSRLSKQYRYLRDLSWSNIYQRPDLQILAGITLWKHNYYQLPNTIRGLSRIAMADAAYNGGYRGVYRDRMLCKMKKGCDQTKWFNNVETTCSKSKKILYGNRSACDINRHHVRDVLFNRLYKYYKYWIDNGLKWW